MSAVEARSARPPANRAVAALQSASNAAASHSPLLAQRPSARPAAPLVRYASFDALRSATQRPDGNAELRAEVARRTPQPSSHTESSAMAEEDALVRVMEMLSSLNTPAATAVGEGGHDAAANHLLTSDVTRVVLEPAMVSATAIQTEEVQRALCAFFTARGAAVQSFAVRSIREEAVKANASESSSGSSGVVAAAAEPVSLLRLPAPWALQLVSTMPYLTELDLRHVQWAETQGSQVLPHLLCDLHLAVPGTLRTLRVDAACMVHWTPGWWRRHVNLSTLTIGCRYAVAEAAAAENGGGAAAAVGTSIASAPPLLELPADFYTLMREEGRHWRLELWCPLLLASLQQLLQPPTSVSYQGVAELLVNVRHNERVCEGAGRRAIAAAAADSATPTAESAADAKASTKRGKGAAPAAEVAEAVVVYPQLHTVSVVDVAERPEAAAEVFAAMHTLAPELTRLNVYDTVLLGAVTADGSKPERGKRSGAAAKHVN